jgi:hypothetical protein
MFDPNKRRTIRTSIPSTPSVTSYRQNLSGAAVKPGDHHESLGFFSHANSYSSRSKASSSTKSQSNTRSVARLQNSLEPSHASGLKDICDFGAVPQKASLKLNTPSKASKLQSNSDSSSILYNSRTGTENRASSSSSREHKPLKNLGLIGIVAAGAWIAYEIMQRQHEPGDDMPWGQNIWGTSVPHDPMVRPDPEGRGNGILTDPQSHKP